MDADVQLGQVEAEELDATPQRRQPAVGHTPGAACSQACVEQVQIGREPGHGRVAGPARALELVPEPPPDEAELAAIRLVEVAVGELGRIVWKLLLFAIDRSEQLGRGGDEPARDPDRAGELADLAGVGRQRQLAGSVERLRDRLRARRRVAVLVASDPGPEVERRGAAGEQLPVVREQQFRDA
jgi:hypothetical protein